MRRLERRSRRELDDLMAERSVPRATGSRPATVLRWTCKIKLERVFGSA
jgi:hypothetical protein